MRDRLLVRHFLWRFVEHDLISPTADRHEIFAITAGTIVTVNLFLSVVIAAQYQMDNFLPPGLVAMRSLDDRFLLFSVTMLVAALVAVAQWDALALDARDTAVLGVLPIPKSVIVRTKLSATAFLGLAVVVGSILPSTVLRLAAIPIGLPVGMRGALWLTLSHGVCALAAGSFGFFAVLGLRETTVALVGARRFRRVSPVMQGALVVVLLTALLLVPGQSRQVAQRWLAVGDGAARAIPVFWFLGLHEAMAGAVFDNLPRVEPDRFLVIPERLATSLYRGLWPLFHELARTAGIALVVLVAVVTLACLWNNRQLPIAAGDTDRCGGAVRRGLRWVAIHAFARTALQQAGFFFALQTLSRRASHRIPMAAALAVGLSFVVIAGGGGRPAGTGGDPIPPSVLIAQSLLIGTVLTGFRHTMRLPADLKASSGFSLAWTGPVAPYVSGIRRAGWIAVVCPSLAVIAIWHVAILGARFALLHGLVGLALSAILMKALFLHTSRVPLVSAHLPDVDSKSHAIIYSVALLIASVLVAGIERWALDAPERLVAFLATLVALGRCLTILDRGSVAVAPPMLEEQPSLPTQRLNLAG
jgi:hypothetical protein